MKNPVEARAAERNTELHEKRLLGYESQFVLENCVHFI